MKLKTLRLVDYANRIHEYELKDKDIICIFVHVSSGDEIAIVYYADDTFEEYDTGEDNRYHDYDDGSYVCPRYFIDRWDKLLDEIIDERNNSSDAISRERLDRTYDLTKGDGD